MEHFLGSASTHVLIGLGGLHGRPLKKGDVLRTLSTTASFRKRTVAPDVIECLSRREVLRVTAGPQSDWFSDSFQQVFYESVYRVAEESSRTGLRLEGSPVLARTAKQMITEGVSPGAIQIPPSGRPIVIFVDQQTTGGYPKIANVISADLHQLGQLRPRDEIRFERIELEPARLLLREQQELLASQRLILE